MTVVACASKNTETPDNTSDITAAEVETTGKSTTGIVKDKFSQYDYNGYEFRILGLSPGEHFYKKINPSANEIYYETDSGDIIDSAIVTRNQMTEDLLNIKISPVWGGGTFDVGNFAKKSIMSDSDDFDMMLMPLTVPYNLAGEGLIANLNDITTIDTSNPWWDQAVVNNFTVAGNLYALTGHYTIFDDYAVPCIFYNQYMVDENSSGDIPSLVRDGKWTIDTMMVMAKAGTADLNGDTNWDLADSWGFMDNGAAFKHLLEGFDITFCESDGKGGQVISLGTERVINAVEKLYNTVISSNDICQTSNADCVNLFSENRCMFYYELLGAINQFRNMNKDFGITPLPKLDEKQARTRRNNGRNARVCIRFKNI